MTCSGNCCLSFCLSQKMVDGLRKDPEEWEDGPYIAAMLIPQEEPLHFTCKHHDPESLLCMAYEARPEMCRNFPKKPKDCDNCD